MVVFWNTNMSKIHTCITHKKHIDASAKERPQTLLVPSEDL